MTIYKKLFVLFFSTNCFFILSVSYFGHSGFLLNENNLSIFIVISIVVCHIVCFWLIKFSTIQIRKTERIIKDIVINETYSDYIKIRSKDELSSIYNYINILFIKIQQSYKKQLIFEKQNVKLNQFSAIAQTTRMLAHDVRRPFSIIYEILWLLENTRDPEELATISKKYTQEVKQALASVDGMIKDIMEAGKTAPLQKRPVSPESIITDALTESCRLFHNTDVNVQYNLNHQYMINVDRLKLQRAFSNIFTNAIQAMKAQKGILWIKTREDLVKNLSIFCIGNSGSYIPKKDLPKLFNPQYTKNKSDGTGLGLAITQKVIEEHGGRIWCRSSKEKQQVEFYFTLPITQKVKNKEIVNLISNTRSPTGLNTDFGDPPCITEV